MKKQILVIASDQRERSNLKIIVILGIAIWVVFCIVTSPAIAASIFDDRDKGAGALDADSYITAVYPGDWNKPSRVAVQPLPSVAPQVFTIQNEDGSVTYYVKGASSLIARDNDTSIVITVDKEGNIKERIGGMPFKDKDYDGSLLKKYERTAASGRITVTNEFGEVVGFQEYGLKKQKLRGYDEKGNLAETSHWNGRRLSWIVDELTNTITQYDENTGNPLYDIDNWGHIIATYYYDGTNNLLYKEDLYGNKTCYKNDGRADYTLNAYGDKIASYFYDSNNRLSYIEDQFGNRVIYEHNKPIVEMDSEGNITKTYNWKGTKLISTTDVFTGEVTVYKNGRPVETYNENGILIKKWQYADEETTITFSYIDPETGEQKTETVKYAAGSLISTTDRYGVVTFFDHGREFMGFQGEPL